MQKVLSLIDGLKLTDTIRGSSPDTFSIQFWTGSGELISIDKAIRCGTKGHQKNAQVIGVKSLHDSRIYTVFIRWIHTINNLEIFWG